MKIYKLSKMKKRIKILLTILFLSLMHGQSKAQAQEKTFEEKARILSEKIEDITTEERSLLKEEIKVINIRLDAGEISDSEAQQLKKKAAERSALHIQQGVSLIEKQLQDLIQNKVDNEIFTEYNRRRFSIGDFDVNYHSDRNRARHSRHYHRTKSNIVIAFGLNNMVTDNSLNSIDDSEYKFWQSHFFEFGVNSKTRVFQNSSHLYVNYGLSLMYNTLRPKRNQFFVADENTAILQTHNEDLDKSKFKNVQLVVPVFLELDFSKPKHSDEDDKVRYRTNQGLRAGAGGFVGVNIKTKQTLKYYENDIKFKDIQKGDFNINNFVYGLSAFVGHKDTSFYVKYNLNELFNNALVEQNNISFGLRFDW